MVEPLRRDNVKMRGWELRLWNDGMEALHCGLGIMECWNVGKILQLVIQSYNLFRNSSNWVSLTNAKSFSDNPSIILAEFCEQSLNL